MGAPVGAPGRRPRPAASPVPGSQCHWRAGSHLGPRAADRVSAHSSIGAAKTRAPQLGRRRCGPAATAANNYLAREREIRGPNRAQKCALVMIIMMICNDDKLRGVRFAEIIIITRPFSAQTIHWLRWAPLRGRAYLAGWPAGRPVWRARPTGGRRGPAPASGAGAW